MFNKKIILIYLTLLLSVSLLNTSQIHANVNSPDQEYCPIAVKNGEVVVPIDFVSIEGVFNKSEYDFSAIVGNQTAHNYFVAGVSSYADGLIKGLELHDGTEVVVEAKDKNGDIAVQETFCFDAPPQECNDPVRVFKGEVPVPPHFVSIIGVYINSEFDYKAYPLENQSATNYYVEGSFANSLISNIDLPDDTLVVVLGKDEKGTESVYEFACHDQGSMGTFGVNAGDKIEYEISHNVSGAIPFFDYENITLESNDKMIIDVLSVPLIPQQMKTVQDHTQHNDTFNVRISVGTHQPFETSNVMFFILPLEFLEDSITKGSMDNLGNVTGYDDVWVEFTYDSNDQFMIFSYNRKHGIIEKFYGEFSDPQGNGIELKFTLTDYTTDSGPAQSVTFGVNVGDKFEYKFTHNVSQSIPFFGYKDTDGEILINSNDTIIVEVLEVPSSSNSTYNKLNQNINHILKIRLTIGSNLPFDTEDSAFFITQLEFLEEIIKNPSNFNELTLISFDADTIVIKEILKGENTLTIDRKTGVLIKMDAVFFDPQNNPIKIDMVLKSGSLDKSSSLDDISNPDENKISTTSGFELLLIAPLIGLISIKRKFKKY